MKTSFAIAAAFLANVYTISAAGINSGGVATSCGQSTCCIPSCMLGNWNDPNGCTGGEASTAGACTNAFVSSTTTSDTGVDICSGAGAFFCTTDAGGRAVFVVNRENQVSVALFPNTYPECTLSGQCAPCDVQGSCQDDPVSIGVSESHSCSDFNALYTASNVNLATC